MATPAISLNTQYRLKKWACTAVYRAWAIITHAVLIITDNIIQLLQRILCTFDISILHQVSLVGKMDPGAEYPSNPAPSRVGVLMDVEV